MLALPTAASASAYEADPNGYARGDVVPAGLTPPAAFAPIGILDDIVDGADVPDVAQVEVLRKSPRQKPDFGAGAEVAHGTEVASVAAGRADGRGVIGVAPGAPLLSWGVKDGSCEEVYEGILALSDAGAKVINLSFEDGEPCLAIKAAIGVAYAQGALVVASSGNEGRKGDPVQYPAAYPHVLTVGALGLDTNVLPDSSGSAGLDLVAPGEAIPVALPPALDLDLNADGVTREDGTSFAAPMISGAASWLIAARPGLTPSQYADLLRATAKDTGAAGWDRRTGFGTVDLAAALAAPVPAHADRGEPDDEAAEVDGTVFTRPNPYVSGTVKATVAPVEDPADFYRVRVRARSTRTIRLTTTFKGVSLSGLRGSKRVAAGRTIRLRNTASKSATFYAVVRASGDRVATALAYTLKVG